MTRAATAVSAGAMRALNAYLPEDRLRALSVGRDLDPNPFGTVLVTDLSGFTTLTAKLEQEAGPRVGPEELIDGLNRIYELFVSAVEAQRGSVVTFIGDALICWFEGDGGKRALTAALAIRTAGAGGLGFVGAGVKVTLASGGVRRFVVGDPSVQCIDVIAGRPVDDAFLAQGVSRQGEILATGAILEVLGEDITLAGRREVGTASFGVVGAMRQTAAPDPWPAATETIPLDRLRPWFLAPVWAGLKDGVEAFTAETRLTTALFQQLPTVNFETEADAATCIDAAVRQVQASVARHGGAVMSVTTGDKGNVVYSSFGTLLALEDDADRAVAAALELSTSGSVQRAGISRGRMRVGAYGARTRRTWGSLGGETNVAARLMDLAQPGQVLVSERAMTQASGRHAFTAVGETAIKGLDRKLRLFVAAGRTARLSTQSLSPLVGRAAELTQFERAIEELRQGRGQTFVLEGDAGMGKSRLLAEVVRSADNLQVFQGHADSIESGTPYFPFRAVFRDVFGLGSDIAVAPRIAEVLAEVPELLALAPLLSPLLPIELPETEVTRQLSGHLRAENLRKLLMGACRLATARAPALMVLEDAHWFDPASLALCDALARSVPNLLIIVSRRTETESADWSELPALMSAPRVTLKGLESAALLDVARQRLGSAELPAAVSTVIAEATRGNPFFAQELASWFHERGLTTPSAADEVPDSIAATITNRIDRLAASQQLTVKVASAFGRVFPVSGLAEAHPGHLSPQVLKQELESLRRSNIVERDDDGHGYRFKHSLLRDTAYGLLLVSQRRDLHARIGRWYETTARLPDTYAKLAHHWREAADIERELKYLELAADQAIGSGAFAEASAFLNRALSQVGPAGRTLAPRRREAFWETRLGRAYAAQALFNEARNHLERGLDLFGFPQPRSAFVRFLRIFAEIAVQVIHRFRDPKALVEPSVEQREVISACSQSHKDLTFAYYFSGEKFHQLHSAVTQLNLAERVGETPELVDGFIHLSVLTGMIGAGGVAESYYDRALGLARKLRLEAPYAWVKLGGAGFRQGMGLWERSIPDAREARDIYERLGDRTQFGYSAMIVAANEFFTGDLPAARESFRLLRELAPRSENIVHRGHGNIFGGITAYYMGDDIAARVLVSDGALLLESTNDIASRIVVHGQLARSFAHDGDASAAEHEIKTTLELISRGIPPGFWVIEGCVALLEALQVLWPKADAASRARLLKLSAELTRRARGLTWVFPVTVPAARLIAGYGALWEGRDAKAAGLFQQSVARARELRMSVDLGRALLALAEVSPSERAQLRAEAAQAFTQAGATRWLAQPGMDVGPSKELRATG